MSLANVGLDMGLISPHISTEHTISRITTRLQMVQEEIRSCVQQLRYHKGASKKRIHEAAMLLPSILEYTKWQGDLAQVKLELMASVDDNEANLNHISRLISEIRPPFYDKAKGGGKYKLSFKDKFCFSFSRHGWVYHMWFIDNLKRALDDELASCGKKVQLWRDVKERMDSTEPSEDIKPVALIHARLFPGQYDDVIQPEIELLNHHPHNRSFLFHGFAGSGKSTVAAALSEHLRLDDSKTVVYIRHQPISLDTCRYKVATPFAEMARQLVPVYAPCYFSDTTQRMAGREPGSDPYSEHLLRLLISDLLEGNAVDLIFDELDNHLEDRFYQFCQEMLKKHPRFRIFFFLRQKSRETLTAPEDTVLGEIVPRRQGIDAITLRAMWLNHTLAKYQSDIVYTLSTQCSGNYYVMFALLVKLCSTDSTAEIEGFLSNQDSDPSFGKQVHDELERLEKSNLRALVIITLTCLERNISTEKAMLHANQICRYSPRDFWGTSDYTIDLRADTLQRERMSDSSHLAFFLADQNGEYALKDPRYMVHVLAYVAKNLPLFTSWFSRSFVEMDYTGREWYLQMAQHVVPVYPDSCKYLQLDTAGRTDLIVQLKKSVPMVYDHDPMSYMKLLFHGNQRNATVLHSYP